MQVDFVAHLQNHSRRYCRQFINTGAFPAPFLRHGFPGIQLTGAGGRAPWQKAPGVTALEQEKQSDPGLLPWIWSFQNGD